MSIHVMSMVWRHGPEDRGELLVLLALADFADDDGYCWPAMQTIADRARMTDRGVRKIVRRLEESGWLSVRKGGGRGGSNGYHIARHPPVNPEPETGNTVPPEPETGNTSAETRNGSAETRNGGSAKPSRTIKEPSSISVDFASFWDAVPRKVGKGAARKAYERALKKTDAATLFSAMRDYAASRAGEDERYTVHPATWLNQERWNDEPPNRTSQTRTILTAAERIAAQL